MIDNESFATQTYISKKRVLTEKDKIKAKEKYEKARDADSKIVTGIVRNLERRGEDVCFSYKKYLEDSSTTFTLKDGEKYTITRGVANHINSIKRAVRDYTVDSRGIKTHKTAITDYEQRYQFTPVDFT